MWKKHRNMACIGIVGAALFGSGDIVIMHYQTVEQLSELHLRAMRQEYLRQIEIPSMSDLSFDERFAMIVNAQINARHTSRINRLLKKAELRDPSALLANIDFDEKRRLPKSLIMQLSDCSWITSGSNLIITGATLCIIYEDNALGKLPDKRYAILEMQFTDEQAALDKEINSLQKKVIGKESSSLSAEKYIALVKKYQDFDEMTILC